MDIVKHSMGGDGGGGGGDSNSTNGSSNNKLYKGVRLRKWGKWVSEIRLPNSRERIWLGSHDSAEKAARAFDAALYCLRGRHASFNFPDTPFDLDINVAAAGRQSLTPQQIQEIAQNFANNKKLPTHDDNNHQQQQQQQQQQQPSLLTCTSATATSSSTQSSMNNIDWTFLNVLDDQSSNAVGSSSSDHYGLFSDLEKMHSGDFSYITPFFEEQIEGDIDNIYDDNDPFSHQSFLWSWNF